MLLAKWQQFCLGLNEISLWNINSLSVYVYVILLNQFCLNILASALEGLPLKYKYHTYIVRFWWPFQMMHDFNWSMKIYS